jgi:hypothetical protein
VTGMVVANLSREGGVIFMGESTAKSGASGTFTRGSPACEAGKRCFVREATIKME